MSAAIWGSAPTTAKCGIIQTDPYRGLASVGDPAQHHFDAIIG
jgi:hypothetical protein